MTTNREAQCQIQEHKWTAWGLWEQTLPKMSPVIRPSADPVFDKTKYLQRRLRQCIRCGLWQAQDGDGKIKDLVE